MQSFSTHRIFDRLRAIGLFLDVAFRAPLESWWMDREVLTIAIICSAIHLSSHQFWLTCLAMKLVSGAAYGQHDPVACPSGCEGPQSVL